MLKLHFLNVGDGDAILIEDIEDGRTFRMLVDAGREQVPFAPPCASCAAHLARLDVSRLDKVVITHLHTDHAGGLAGATRRARIDELICGYIPLDPGAQIPAEPQAEKTVRDMIASVNQWSRDVAELKASGCRTLELFATLRDVCLTRRLRADFIVPDVGASRLQRDVWNRMLDGRDAPNDQRVRASKLRNPNSLRVRLHYAGREIELAGDCYGSAWEDEAEPCDILKTPHHGDVKSLTDALVEKLRPSHAVISCGREYLPAKDRPSAAMVQRLIRVGSRVWYTDAFSDGRGPARVWPSVDFTIFEDGRIAAPQ